MKNSIKRFLSTLLAVGMILSCSVITPVRAEGEQPDPAISLDLGEEAISHGVDLNKYISYSSQKETNRLIFNSADGTNSTNGTIVAISDQINKQYGSTNAVKFSMSNHWASVIGGSDGSYGQARGLVFNGGTIYAGAGEYENCGAIGGGGNDHATVTIAGGIVTAVANTTGAGIGGGIGHRSSGGTANITISGGMVYAYNFGVKAKEWVTEYGGANETQKANAAHISGAAIGGGSSIIANGNTGTVNISGGTVYAESLGGCAIGGGSSIVGNGGKGNVTIRGGHVTARSTSAIIDFETTPNKEASPVSASTAIGGGFSAMATGGATTVTISDGTIVSDGIGGGFSDVKGYNNGTVTITGGSLNSAMAAIPTNGSENVFLTRVAFIDNKAIKKNAQINSLTRTAINRSLPEYGLDHVYTDENGMGYFWLPQNVGITSAQSDGIIYTPIYEDDGIIDSKDIGMILTDASPRQYIVNIASTEYFDLYQKYENETLQSPFSGAIIVPEGQFECYLDVADGWEITPYLEQIANGVQSIQPAPDILTDISGNIKKLSRIIYRDTRVWFALSRKDEDPKVSYFTVDLTCGDVDITQDVNGKLTIVQDNSTISGFEGSIYLTSSGYPTANNVNIQSETENESDPAIDIYVNHIAANSDHPIINVESGNVDLRFGTADNIINTSQGAPIYVAQDGELNITMESQNSVKIDGASQSSAIVGEGSVSITNTDHSFLKLNQGANKENKNTSNLSVGEYTYKGPKAEYTATLYDGTYSYLMIGYIDESGMLYSKDNLTNAADNTKNFSARGILEVFNGVKVDTDGYTIDSEGNLIFTLVLSDGQPDTYIGEISTQSANGLPTIIKNNDDSEKETTYRVKIDSSAFKDGNIKILGASSGKIAYIVTNYSSKYDGNAHSIDVAFDTTRFDITYSTTENGDYSSERPMQTNVTNNMQIWFKIKPHNSSSTYETVEDCGTITITKGENEWITELICGDIAKGSIPSPSSTAKWNDSSKTYRYEYNETETETFDQTGKYSVTVTVAGDGKNYDPITVTKYFFVYEVVVYCTPGRELDPIPTSGTTATAEIAKNGTVTIYFASPRSEDAILSFFEDAIGTKEFLLPQNTKITLIEINNESSLATVEGYYYYEVGEQGTSSIKLDEFKSMASEKNHQQAGNAYQVCFDFSEATLEINCFYVKLWENTATINTPFQYIATFGAIPEEPIEKELPLTITAGGAGYQKILSFRFSDTVSAELYDGATPVTLLYSNENTFSYLVANEHATLTNKSYTLKLFSEEEKMTFDCYISLVENLSDVPYVINGAAVRDEVRVTVSNIPKPTPTGVFVAELDGKDRIVTKDVDSLTFKTNIDNGKVTVTPQIKTINGYVGDQSFDATITNGTFTIARDSIFPFVDTDLINQQSPMIVRLVFEYEGMICNYNLIITP